MATPLILDIEPLLEPISEASPSGRSLAYEKEYDALREARRADEDVPQGDWQHQTKAAQWERVLDLGGECLRTKSKDLQIAAWMTEALGRLHDFAGLRDGFALLTALLERFWDSLFPAIDEGDLEARGAPFEFLNHDRLLPLLIRSIPLTDASGERCYSFLRWQESRATDNTGKRSPELLETLIAEGKITGEQFDEAAAQTPRRFYESLAADLLQAEEAYRALDAAVDARFGREAPSLGGIRKAIEDCRRVVDPILASKRAAEPDEADEPAVEEPAAAEPGEDPGDAEDAPAADAAPARPRRPARSAGGPITDPEDAIERILAAAAFLRQHDPGSPAPYLVVRAVRMAEVFALGPSPAAADLPSPASERRQALKRLAGDGDWTALLELAEETLGRPEGRAWLDAQRYALTAMTAAGDADRSTAAVAVRRMLQAFLAEYPDLPRAELSDDTPTANAETRQWLESEILPPPPSAAAAIEPLLSFDAAPEDREEPSGAAGEDAPPDPWDLAREDLRGGRPNDGLARLRRAIAGAATGREKFRRKLQMAELCLMAGTPRVAQPLLEELARQIDEFRLEQWEEEELSARVWGALYRCLRSTGAENGAGERLREVYDRLCRLDINQALAYDQE